jgi:hypothetical protein
MDSFKITSNESTGYYYFKTTSLGFIETKSFHLSISMNIITDNQHYNWIYR